MDRGQVEKLSTLFLAVFSSGLALQFAADGMNVSQWLGALVAVTGSLALVGTVRLWPAPARAEARK